MRADRHGLGRMAGLTAALAIAATTAATAGENLYAAANGSFDADIAGWTEAAHGAVSHDAAAGALLGAGPNQSLTVPGPCVAAAPDTGYTASVRVQLAAGTTYVCGFNVFQFTDAGCSEGSSPLFAEASLVEPAWQTVTASGRTGTDTRSLRLSLACSGEPDFSVRFDDVAVSAD